MKIAYDSTIFYTQRYGGISRYFFEVTKKISKSSQLKIFAPIYINKYLKNSEKSIVHGSFIQTKSFFLKVILRKVVNFIALQSIKRYKPDIIHFTYYDTKKLSKLQCVKVITIHDLIHEKFPHFFSRLDSTAHQKKNAINNADHIICVSENTKNDLVQLYNVAPEKISVIYLGVQKLKSQKIISESGIKPYILFNGKRDGYKNFYLLLRAYSENEYLKTNFDVYTFGGGNFSKEELKLLNVLNLKNNQVKNFQGEDSLLGYLYDNANIFVYPSLYEGFGLPPLEAMVHGCPVLSSNRGSMPEILGDAAEYFDPTQSVELSFKLNLILKSQTKMNELMQKGILKAQEYDWSECASQTEELYKNLLEKKSAT